MIPRLILAAATSITVPSQDVDAGRFLESVRQVAGTDGTGSPLGPFDLTRAVWNQHAHGIPYVYAREKGHAALVARRHVKWLSDGLERAGMAVTAYNLGACWNLGLVGGIKAVKQGRKISYADSVHNIYYEYAKQH